jgi:hypothetical protein
VAIARSGNRISRLRQWSERWSLDIALASLQQALNRDPALPVRAEWTMPAGYRLPEALNCSRHPGLMYCELLHGDAATRLVTYWKSRDHLKHEIEAFRIATGAEGQHWAGTLVDGRTAAKLYQPTSFIDGIIKVAALIGAITACYQMYAVFLAAPQVSMSLDAVQPIDASAASPVTIPLAFTNHSGSSSARVDLTEISSSVASTGIDFGENYFQLDSGERVETRLTGHTGDPGSVRLNIHASAHAGRLRFARDLAVTAEIKVWPVLERSPFEVLARECSDDRCISRASLHVGRKEANGFDCWARFVGVPNVTIRAVRSAPDGGGVAVETGAGPARMVKIDWRESGSDAFRDRAVDVVLSGRPPNGEWGLVASKMEWLCDPVSPTGGS